jgi:hypothetical protein
MAQLAVIVMCRSEPGPPRPTRRPAPSATKSLTTQKATNGELTITCRGRHCPKCQANARDRWLEARRQELLPTRYVPSGQPPLLGAGPLRTGLESFPSSGSSIQ